MPRHNYPQGFTVEDHRTSRRNWKEKQRTSEPPTLPETDIPSSTWKWMAGRWVSFSGKRPIFRGLILVSGRVKHCVFYHGWQGWWKETNPYHTYRTIYPHVILLLFLMGCLVSHDSGMLHQGDRWIRPRNPWPCESARQCVKRMSWEFLPFEMEHFKMEWRSFYFNRILTFFVSGLLRISCRSIGIDLK